MRKQIFFAKKLIKNPASVFLYNKLRANQHLSADAISVLNWEKRLRLVRYAYEHVPIYRKKYIHAGIENPLEIRSENDFENLPIITKDDLRNENGFFFSDCVPRSLGRESVTGGSSGVPVSVYHDSRIPVEALGWRMLAWWGLAPNENDASVWRDVHGISGNTSLLRKLKMWPAKSVFLDASAITEREAGIFLERMKSSSAKILRGYVGAIEYLALFAEKHSVVLPKLELVWVTSAPVTNIQRKLFKRAFNASVLDQYGCCEVYWLAAECPKSKRALHFFSDVRHIEFVDEDNTATSRGELGRVLLTDLENYVFPLIRYENGDQGSWSLKQQCDCGCNLPLIDPIKGRVTESVVLPDGTLLTGDTLTTVFDESPRAVSQFQIHQQKDGSIILRVVQSVDYEKAGEEIEMVAGHLRELVLGQVEVVLERVAEIPHDRGKTRYVISDLVR